MRSFIYWNSRGISFTCVLLSFLFNIPLHASMEMQGICHIFESHRRGLFDCRKSLISLNPRFALRNRNSRRTEILTCVGGGLGNQINGIRAALILGAVSKSRVRVVHGYDYANYLAINTYTRFNAKNITSCPQVIPYLQLESIARKQQPLPNIIQFSGGLQHDKLSKLLNMTVKESECLLRASLRPTEKLQSLLNREVGNRNTFLGKFCSDRFRGKLISLHVRVGDYVLIDKKMTKKKGMKPYHLHRSFQLENLHKFFTYASSFDDGNAIFFLATDSSAVKKVFRTFFSKSMHFTQDKEIRHFKLLRADALDVNMIDFLLMSFADILIHTGSSFAQSANLLSLNPRQVQYKF